MATTGLSHIQEGQFDQTALAAYSNSFSIGPLKIEYDVDLTRLEIDVKALLAGVQIGSGTLNAQNPSLSIGGGVAGFKAEATLRADFQKKNVAYEIQLCAPIVGCKNYSGVLVSW